MKNINLNYQICDHKTALEQFAFKFTQNFDDADDLVQDTMIKAMRYSGLYQEGTNLKGWLYTIMKNTFINDYRKTASRKKVIDTVEDLNAFQLLKSAKGNDSDNKFISDDINVALKKLSPVYAVPFLKHFEGFKYHEIADELNIPIGTVKTRIHVARQLLKDSLKMYTEDFNRRKDLN